MFAGVILGYFYGKGLLLCPSNTIRYFDLNDDIYYDIKRDIGWHCNEDKRNNVKIVWGIKENFVVLYENCPEGKYKARIAKRFSVASEEMKNEATVFYNYFTREKPKNIKSSVQYEIKKILKYVNEFDLEKELDKYRAEKFKKGDLDFYWIDSIDTTDKYILNIVHPSNVNREERLESLIGRDYEREDRLKNGFREKYSKDEHLKYLLESSVTHTISSFMEEYTAYSDITATVNAQYPFDEVAYIIHKTWPHMKAELLCYKYNEEYKNGADYKIFGDKNNSRRQYLKRREGTINRRNHRYRNSYSTWDSWDPESEIMNSLMYGDPEVFGF